jgi:proteasome lid subunit RPN8/RPN11
VTDVTLVDLEQAGLLAAVRAQAEAEYPNECCGLLLRSERGLERLACTNEADLWHARDPLDFPRTARTSYLVAPRVIIEHERRIAVVYHSHPDHPAMFSDEDHRQAAPLGEPLYPGVAYLVVAVWAGRATESRLFRWDDSRGGYAEAGGAA